MSKHASRFGTYRGAHRRSQRVAHLSITALLVLGLAVVNVFALSGIAFAANPAANLDQCANDPAPSPNTDGCNSDANQWVNGNLGASKSFYKEGDSIPYRLTFSNLTLSSHVAIIEWDTTKGGKHALDYLTTYNQSVGNANPCLGVSGCSSLTPTIFPIPADPQVTGGGVTPIAGNFTLWGGTITAVSSYSYPNGTGFAGDKSAQIAITFTSTVANPVLAWGGHIATRKDWGSGNSAVAIPGSPYHTRLISLDGAGGNQDRSLSAEAVVFPGFIHIVKNTTGGNETFGYTASPSPLSNFNITTSGGTGERDFNDITTFQTYTVNESTIPLHWVFDTLTCSVAAGTANGGSQTVNGTQVAINLKEGEQVTCTYTNHHGVNSPTIATVLSDDSITVGGTIHDSATLTGATPDAGGSVAYRYYATLTACNADTDGTGGTGAGTKTVTNGSVPNSDDVTFNSAGTFYFRAWYSGDANNDAASSNCADEVVTVTQQTNSQITPTATTCSDFLNGADTLSFINYSLKNNKISQVDPGVFFYWVEVTASAGTNSFVIDQTPGIANTPFLKAAGSAVFTSGCTKVVNATITQDSGGDVTVDFTASQAGTYVIGIKYSTSNIKGAADPGTVDYTFQLAGDSSTLESVTVRPKP